MLFVAIVVVLVNLLVDLSYGLLNPRIRLAGRYAVSVAEIEAREVELHTPPGGLWREALRRVLRNPGAIVGARRRRAVRLRRALRPAARAVRPDRAGPLARSPRAAARGRRAEHPLGVDDLGRDELSRIIYGARYSF